MSESNVEVLRDAVKIGCEKLHPEIPRSLLRRPGVAIMFVGAEKKPASFLSHVDFATEVNAVKNLVAGCFVVSGDFGEVFGKNVGVFHCQHR